MSKPSIFQDPWRTPVVETKPRKSEQPLQKGPVGPLHKESDDFNAGADGLGIHPEHLLATLELKNYGGVSVQGCADLTVAAAHILDYLVQHADAVNAALIYHSLLLAPLDLEPTGLKFYIRRADGWTLSAPTATARDDALCNLIQALLRLRKDETLRAAMDHAQICPFKY